MMSYDDEDNDNDDLTLVHNQLCNFIRAEIWK